MEYSPEASEEERAITRRGMQDVVLHDSVSIVDYGDDVPISPTRGDGTGRMILDFGSGELEVTVTSTEIS